MGTPRGFGPCGTVLDRDVALLFSHPERHFSYLADVTPCIDEGLLLPFYVDGEGIGTIWVIAHDQSVRFDSEDLRVMTSLASFASTAYQTLLSLERKLEAEAQRTQLLQETDKLQKALLNSISHDLRTPLASITRSSGQRSRRLESAGCPDAAPITRRHKDQLGG